MSKTDKTRPWDVKAKENPLEKHDHRNGVCDLARKNPPTSWEDGKCWVDAKWWRPEFRCHCKMCSGEAYGYGPKQINRKARQAAKKMVARFRPNVDDCDCYCHSVHDAELEPFCGTRCDNGYSNLCSGGVEDD